MSHPRAGEISRPACFSHKPRQLQVQGAGGLAIFYYAGLPATQEMRLYRLACGGYFSGLLHFESNLHSVILQTT
jgi:hypothetical protein